MIINRSFVLIENGKKKPTRNSGKYRPACRITHTGIRSTSSPLAARNKLSFFNGGKFYNRKQPVVKRRMLNTARYFKQLTFAACAIVKIKDIINEMKQNFLFKKKSHSNDDDVVLYYKPCIILMTVFEVMSMNLSFYF